MPTSIYKRTHARLEQVDALGQRRRLRSPAGVDLSSNNYLGLADNQALKQAAIGEIERAGVGSTGSRLLRGHHDVFSEAEAAFADWKDTEGSLFFSSGYLANIGTLQTFVERGDIVFSDELNHASLIDGVRLTKGERAVFPHCNLDELARRIRHCDASGQKFLLTESLFSMDGDIAPLDRYAELCRETNTAMIVDEAHAIGIFGQFGSGLIEEFRINEAVFLSINTAGKALGVAGAFVAGGGLVIDYLLQKARTFIFSTASIPAVPAALVAGIRLARSADGPREKLFNTTRRLRAILGINDAQNGLVDRSPIVPIHIGDNEKACRIADRLQSEGFDVRAIRPPTVPEGTARLRVSLNASIDEATLLEFAECMITILNEEGVEVR